MTNILILDNDLIAIDAIKDHVLDSSIKEPKFFITESIEQTLQILSENNINIIILCNDFVDSEGDDVLSNLTYDEKQNTIAYSSNVSFLIKASHQRIYICRKGDYYQLVEIVKEKLKIY